MSKGESYFVLLCPLELVEHIVASNAYIPGDLLHRFTVRKIRSLFDRFESQITGVARAEMLLARVRQELKKVRNVLEENP